MVLSIIIFPSGCSQPDPKYQTPTDEENVLVHGSDLGISKELYDRIGGHLLSTQPSAGRFPSGLCVVRVDVLAREADGRRFLRIVKMPRQHAVYWNHAFDDLSSIREVVFLGTSGLDPRGYRWQDLLVSAEKVECNLCLLYAHLDVTDADAEYVGVLWDAHALRPLAVFHVPMVLPLDFKEKLGDDEKHKEEREATILWEANFRAEQDFRRLVRDRIWDLAKLDGEPATTQPNPWKSDVPIFPRDYLRYRDPRYNQSK